MIGGSVLVGYGPDRRGADALALAAVVVRGTGGTLTVASVRPPAWPVPGPGKVDAEWEGYLDGQAHAALAGAAEVLEQWDLSAEYLVAANRGSGRGLAHLVGRAKADLIVIGSAPGGPRHGIALGSTADQLLHGSPVPVMLAPKGYAQHHPETFDRITVAYLRRPGCEQAVDLAARIAVRRGTPLRLLTVAVGHKAKGRAAQLAEEQTRKVVDLYESDLAAAAKEAEDGGILTAERITTEVAQGPDAATAIAGTEWSDGELVVLASSAAGPLRKVFMGDMSLKILRAVPCPAVVLPRTTH
jgi:nucleotide-binding universal stress UspA family protein